MGEAKPPETCLVCSAPVWRRSPNGYPYCKPHYQEAEASVHQQAVFDELLDWAPSARTTSSPATPRCSSWR